MESIDFGICPFLKEELCYYTYYDFCENAKIIKAFFDALDYNERTFYKWYVYANIHMDENHKNLIWEYLNNPELEYYLCLLEGKRNYKVK